MAQVIYGNQFQGGLVRIPPSKSAAHRQVLCAALSRGKCTLSHVDMSEDIQATVAAVEALGAKVSFDEAADPQPVEETTDLGQVLVGRGDGMVGTKVVFVDIVRELGELLVDQFKILICFQNVHSILMLTIL